MAKQTSQFVCQQCGAVHLRMMGKCTACGAWGSVVEEVAAPAAKTRAGAARAAAKPVALTDDGAAAPAARMATGEPELDRVLGGGLVPGAVALLGGDPGIGKSTLVMQVCRHVAAGQGKPVLYVTGEESVEQVRLRARRLECLHPGIRLLAENSLEAALEALASDDWAMMVADSIQTLSTADLPGTAGSVGQVRECAARLQEACKARGIPCLLVGHVTKDGSLAGPRVLEHLVDVVLQFEAAEATGLRTLRALKNRFGSTQELGLFEMAERGLAGVDNPSALFLSPGGAGVALCSLQGSRPLLCEVQALVTPTHFGQPQRGISGLDPYRLPLLFAVLEKRCGLALYSHDVFVSAAGGLRITEPAADLAVAIAVAAGLKNQAPAKGLACFGEVGLSGELRPVSQAVPRLREAARLGCAAAVCPAPAKDSEVDELRKAAGPMHLHLCANVTQALKFQ